MADYQIQTPYKQQNSNESQFGKCRKNCKVHKFQIKTARNQKCRLFGSEVSVRFCKIESKNNTSLFLCTVPRLFSDYEPSQVYLPLFQSQYDQESNKNKKEYYEKRHEEKKKEYLLPNKGEIYEPKPRKQNCQICKNTYKDYFEHVKDPKHVEKMNKNSLMPNIEKVANLFNKMQGREQTSIFSNEKKQIINIESNITQPLNVQQQQQQQQKQQPLSSSIQDTFQLKTQNQARKPDLDFIMGGKPSKSLKLQSENDNLIINLNKSQSQQHNINKQVSSNPTSNQNHSASTNLPNNNNNNSQLYQSSTTYSYNQQVQQKQQLKQQDSQQNQQNNIQII